MQTPRTSDSSMLEGQTPFRKILVPTDFSSCAQCALDYALGLARHFGAVVQVLHVIHLGDEDVYRADRTSLEVDQPEEALATVVLDQLKRTLAACETKGLRVEPVVRYGAVVAPMLLAHAEEEGVDLIVMGTHGRSGVSHWFVGSVAEETVRRAPSSVLTVREGERSCPDPLHRVLVPLDFSEHTEELLRFGTQLAMASGAQLDLLHVLEPLPFLGRLAGALTVHDLQSGRRKQSYGHLERLRDQMVGPAVPAKLHVEEGHAAEHIVSFAARCGTDLIVIATQGRSGAERFLLGSVAERVVRTAPCPVLTFRTATMQPAEAANVRTSAALSSEQPA